MKYGTYANIGEAVPSSVGSTGKTCLIYLGNCGAPDYGIHYITSWADAQESLYVRPQTDVIMGDACFVCLDMLKIPFYAVKTHPYFIPQVVQTVADFVENTEYDSYIICIIRMNRGEVRQFWDLFDTLITKPVFYIGDFSENPLDHGETQYVLENGRPNVEKIIEVKGTLPQDAQHEISFGYFKHPTREYPVALSALRAGFLAINDVFYKAPVRVDGNLPFDAESLQGKRFDPKSYIPMTVTKADADTLAENGVNSALKFNGIFRTWGDLCADGETFISDSRMASSITNWFKNKYLNKTPLTLCDRDIVIRDVTSYLESLVAIGAMYSARIDWVETGEGTGVWQFTLGGVEHRPIRALTAQVRYGDVVINYL